MRLPTLLKLLIKLPNRIQVLFWIVTTTIIINTLSLVIPIYFLQVYDRIIPNSSTTTLLYLTIGAVIIIIIDSVLTIGRGVISSWYSAKFSFNEGSKLMEKLFTLTNENYYKTSMSEYFESFRSIGKLKKIYSGQIFQSLLDIPFIFIFLYGIYYLAGELVFFHIFMLLLYTVFNFIYHFIIIKYKRTATNDNNRRFDYLREILSKIHPLKATGIEESLIRKLEIVQERYSKSYFLMKNRLNVPRFLGEFLSQVMIYGTIVLGGIMFVQGELSLGIISAATMLARRTVGPLLSISKLSMSLSEAKLDFERLRINAEEIDREVDKLPLPGNIEGFLEIRDLTIIKSKNIHGNLKEINLSAEKGFITGVICNDALSANLLVDTIMGIEKPDSGEVLLDSIKLNKFSGINNIPGMAIIPQKPELFSGSILDNITLFNEKLYIQALDTAAFLNLNPLVAKLPKGYETEITPHSNTTLPSSLIHRISIARALVKRPRLIISNQADGVMNEETRRMYLEVLSRLKPTTSIIIISENHKTLNIADKLYLLNDSSILKLEDSSVRN